jgi:quinol---cytochrome c reductase iron-sulfur subunit, bacillus type
LEPNRHDEPQPPAPSLWPIGFAIGIVGVLVGLIVSWPAVAVGAAIAVFCGFMWIRDAAPGYRDVVEPEEPRATRRVAAPATDGGAAPPLEDEEIERFPRKRFLEASTLGLGVLIGGIVTVPVLGFMVAPAFVHQDEEPVDLGPIENFPEGGYQIATFFSDPSAGEVARRTAFVRNNGLTQDGVPSCTILSNRCVHLGCPVQPGGPVEDEASKTVNEGRSDQVTIIPTQPANFSCPCHGGSYDTEGNRIAGPPVRALNRYEFEIRDGNLVLLDLYSVSYVEGTGADAKIHAYRLAGPGEHVDGLEALFYPIQAPS